MYLACLFNANIFLVKVCVAYMMGHDFACLVSKYRRASTSRATVLTFITSSASSLGTRTTSEQDFTSLDDARSPQVELVSSAIQVCNCDSCELDEMLDQAIPRSAKSSNALAPLQFTFEPRPCIAVKWIGSAGTDEFVHVL